MVRAYAGDAGDARIPAGGAGIMAVLCGWAVSLYAILIFFHMGLVAVLSSATGVSATVEIAETIEEWADVQRDDDRTEAELAAILSEYGSWNPEAPEAGIPALFPKLGEVLPAGDLPGAAACSITIAAGVTADRAAPDLNYCIRTACPSPVAWAAPPAVALWSSHPSGKEHWLGSLFPDVFANGRAPAPGGYCTADGELADEFQG